MATLTTPTPLKFFPNERAALFIDGANCDHTMQGLGWWMDWIKLRILFEKHCHLVRPYYYLAVDGKDVDDNRQRALTDALKFNGYRVVSKMIYDFRNHQTGEITARKGNLDIEIAVDMMLLAPHIDHFILMSGDGDFCAVVRALQNMGKRVSLLSTLKITDKVSGRQVKVLSDDLRKLSDHFIEIEDLRQWVSREPTDRTRAGMRLSPTAAPQTENA